MVHVPIDLNLKNEYDELHMKGKTLNSQKNTGETIPVPPGREISYTQKSTSYIEE